MVMKPEKCSFSCRALHQNETFLGIYSQVEFTMSRINISTMKKVESVVERR